MTDATLPPGYTMTTAVLLEAVDCMGVGTKCWQTDVVTPTGATITGCGNTEELSLQDAMEQVTNLEKWNSLPDDSRGDFIIGISLLRKLHATEVDEMLRILWRTRKSR